MLTSLASLTALSLALLVSVRLLSQLRVRATLPLPPGPPGEFLVGHARVMPKDNVAETYAAWGAEYRASSPPHGFDRNVSWDDSHYSAESDIIHVKALRKSVVVLNSVEAARDLLERKGASYCDRPRFPLLEV